MAKVNMKAILRNRPIHLHVHGNSSNRNPGREHLFSGESRWPMAGAVLAVIVLTVLMPKSLRLGPLWALPFIEGFLLISLIASDPGQITRRSRELRALSIGLVVLLAASSLASTGFLIEELISGSANVEESSQLLATGVTVWTGNTLAFALLFWELDSRGPAARARTLPPYPDFAFPQFTMPDLAPPGWRPRFFDFLYLSVTNSITFGPTDVIPLAMWAKAGMGLQSLISFAIVGLVIARAVNVFS
jgi:uncharacterized membrane protein